MSDVDISVSSRPASRSSSLDTCGLDQQHLAQAKAVAQTATMVTLGACLLLCTSVPIYLCPSSSMGGLLPAREGILNRCSCVGAAG
jgi:hypothetical protein